MGKRRGRRTRSDDVGGTGSRGWPILRYGGFTWEGTLERYRALSLGSAQIRRRGGRRGISNRDLVVPILTTAILLAVVVGVVAVVLRLAS